MPRAARSLQKSATSSDSGITITVPTQSGRPPEQKPSEPAPSFWEAVHGTSAEQWRDERVVYVYRDNPTTAGMKGNIHTFREDFDEDTLREMFGGYEYRLMLVRRKTGTMIAATKVDIAAPPKAAGKMDPSMINFGAAGATPTVMANGTDMTTVLNQFVGVMRDQLERTNPGDKNTIELLMTASKKAIDIATQQQSASPVEMMRLMMDMQKQNQGPENSMMMLLLGKIVERAFAPPESNLLGQLSAFEKIADLIGIRSGGGAGKNDLGAMLINKLPDIAQGASVLMTKYVEGQREKRMTAEANARGIAVARAGGAPPIADAIPPVHAAAAPGNVREFQPAAGAPTFSPLDRDPVNTAPPDANAIPPEEEGGPSFDWLRRRVVQMIMMGTGGETIVDFISGANPQLIAALRSATLEQLREFFVKDAILSQAASYAGFETFLTDAVTYMNEESVAEPVH